MISSLGSSTSFSSIATGEVVAITSFSGSIFVTSGSGAKNFSWVNLFAGDDIGITGISVVGGIESGSIVFFETS